MTVSADDLDGDPLRLLPFTDAATILGVSRATVHRLVRDGHLAPTEMPSGRRYLARAELQRFVEDRTVR